MAQKTNITICACTSRSFIDKEKVAFAATVLKREGYEVAIEPDLCKKVMQCSSGMEEIASSTILACYPRAVRSLFHPLGLEPRQVVDIRTNELSAVWSELQVKPAAIEEDNPEKTVFLKEIEDFPVETGMDAWYPVIDKDRCIECEKCHDFCLFGVYTVENGRVKVNQPQNCKNNCPACARICPAKAVIFPKYEKSPINGGLADEEQIMTLDTKVVYADALRTRLQHRRAGVSLLKRDNS